MSDIKSPYEQAALGYVRKGWSPIPLPPSKKAPVPNGFTGATGRYVQEIDVKRWIKSGRFRAGEREYPLGNVAIRLPKDVIGIDVDNYDGRDGLGTIAFLEEKWGPLPRGMRVSSRDDGSGIYLFKVPTGLAWPGDLRAVGLGTGVELIRWDHRYVIVPPSVHPDTGEQYRWLGRTA